MEITIESIKLTAEKAPRAIGEPQDTYIKIEFLAEFSDKVKPVSKVLASKLKESISENTTELLINKLKKLPALMLDEWGQNYGSDWEEQKLEEIVIAREREGLITIITTNLELDKLPERVISRARDATQARIILNKAVDYRPKKKAKRNRSV